MHIGARIEDSMNQMKKIQGMGAGARTRRWQVLRERHPRFAYEGYSVEEASEGVRVRYRFKLDPDIIFEPETVIEAGDWLRDAWDSEAMDNFAFNLGLVEMLSYWKAACSPEIVVRAGQMEAAQATWWQHLLKKGMGEYFYVNGIDIQRRDLVVLITNVGEEEGKKQVPRHSIPRDDMKRTRSNSRRDLALTSGGKDTVVTLEILREANKKFDCLLLNPTQAALDVARQALRDEWGKAIIVRRTIDPRLLELNKDGYLNGHTPFSALLAFLGVAVAVMGGYRSVIASNERSAEEATVEYLGVKINHQYSKSLEFETAFRKYCREFLKTKAEYYSLLRPLYELQITRLFARHKEYFPLFKSCNRGAKDNSWCGRCPKCLFVYAALYPFVERGETLEIFGDDLFEWEGAGEVLKAMLGLDEAKPFECVGTKEETLAALYLCAEKYKEQGRELPRGLKEIEEAVLDKRNDLEEVAERVMGAWGEKHHLGAAQEKAMRRMCR